jgi:hypothetical protein
VAANASGSHAELRAAVREAVRGAGARYREVLAESSVAVPAGVRQRATRAAFAQWGTPTGRALAASNGSARRALVGEVAVRASLSAWERDRLASRLRAETPGVLASEEARVAADLVQSAAAAAKRVVRDKIKRGVERGVDRAIEQSRWRKQLRRLGVGGLPAGVPLLPPFGWYATMNAWSVSARGSWAEFTVAADTGSPLDAARRTEYVREDERVAFDVNGDGRPDAVGHNERVSFRVDATVAVIVPPGPRGVGDVGGNADERSPGW